MTEYHCKYDELADPNTLVDHPRNHNKHPRRQLDALVAFIRHSGWRHAVVVSRLSGLIVAGDARKLAGIEIGCEVPVVYQDFKNEAEERAFLAADNKLAELAEMDVELLAVEVAELEVLEVPICEFGFDKPKPVVTEPEEPKVDQIEELLKKWDVKTGQLWGLGNHRLLCGDSTVASDVETALCGDSPLLMVTDPPYGVEYDAAWRNEAAKHCKSMGNRKDRAVGVVENDTNADWSRAWELFKGDVAYVWHAGLFSSVVFSSLVNSGLIPRAQIIWAKNQLVIGRGDYHYQHEPCWYAVRKGKKGLRTDDRTQTTLWKIDKPQKSETGHSTQKPIECMARPIRNHDSEFVYEPFSGSGTTIIACEQLGRKCRAIELNPGYVAVTLQRFMDSTGIEPELIK